MSTDSRDNGDTRPVVNGKIIYSLPIPHAIHMEPKGRLLNIPAQHALWYFLRCAHVALHEVPTQITYEGDEDTQTDFKHLAESIARAGNTSIKAMFASELWRRAQAEAESCGLTIDERVSSFINSGGQTHRFYDRDPDSHEQGMN